MALLAFAQDLGVTEMSAYPHLPKAFAAIVDDVNHFTGFHGELARPQECWAEYRCLAELRRNHDAGNAFHSLTTAHSKGDSGTVAPVSTNIGVYLCGPRSVCTAFERAGPMVLVGHPWRSWFVASYGIYGDADHDENRTQESRELSRFQVPFPFGPA